VDVRLVAATHRDLSQMVAEGRFREDLYYRLRGLVLEVPPLRRRALDLPHLIDAFGREACAGRKKRPPVVTSAAMRMLAIYAWPGNVRELRSEVHRWAVFCDDRVDVDDLSPEIRASTATSASTSRSGASRLAQQRKAHAAHPTGSTITLREAVEATERETIRAALAQNGGNLLRTAQSLKVERNTLKRKLRAFGLYSAAQ
jgi:DNA-binding NtrC family response regulator